MDNLQMKQVEGIKVIQVELSHKIEEMEIVPIGDVHVGDEFFDKKFLDNVIKYVLEKENRYVILTGDLMDMALKMSVSDTYGATLSPAKQVEMVAKIFLPIKDRILAMTTGNHEFRVYKFTGIDVSRYLALELGIEDRYSDNSFVLFVKVGESQTSRPSKTKKQVYSIFVQHGSGGGRKNGSKLNRLNDTDEIVATADLYISSHTHSPIGNIMSTFITDTQNMTITRHNKHYLLSNSYLSFGGYGLTFGFAPSAKQISRAILYTKGKKSIEVAVGNPKF
jgi:predicted phosphodiesterase